MYFPCDPRIDNFDDDELIKLIADIRSLINKSDCANVVFAGDFNCHFERYTHYTNIVKEELDDLGLALLWQQPGMGVDFTYSCMQNDNMYYSKIDHFVVNDAFFSKTDCAGNSQWRKSFESSSYLCKD